MSNLQELKVFILLKCWCFLYDSNIRTSAVKNRMLIVAITPHKKPIRKSFLLDFITKQLKFIQKYEKKYNTERIA